VARLVPVVGDGTTRKLGLFRGQMTIPDDFDAPLPDDILDAFEGKTQRTKTKRKKS
jgi:antitoxin (DNA-binding transcriptional repressor) of toxin-antitoxin stability system